MNEREWLVTKLQIIGLCNTQAKQLLKHDDTKGAARALAEQTKILKEIQDRIDQTERAFNREILPTQPME